MPTEKCVTCGKDTNVEITTHIDARVGYLEGVGQLCISCHLKDSNREHIVIPKQFINQYSNDMELGSKVREFYRNLYK